MLRRSTSNIATLDFLIISSVCSRIALTERMTNAAYNYQRLQKKSSRKCPPGVSAPFPLLHGLLELPVFASHFAAPAIFSSIFRALRNVKSRAVTNRLTFDLQLRLPHASTSHLCQRISTNDRRAIAYNSPHNDYHLPSYLISADMAQSRLPTHGGYISYGRSCDATV